jgi:hypothetical protein
MTPERETSRAFTLDESETNRAGGGGGSGHLGGRSEDARQEREQRTSQRETPPVSGRTTTVAEVEVVRRGFEDEEDLG